MPDSSTLSPSFSPSAIALRDDRPFFAQALAYGVSHGILDADKMAAIHTDAPKGMVQIARYFGSEFLRPELEKARERMVNLISLFLLDATRGDLHEAALQLRDHSLLSRSKGGSDMLKRLIAMPESSNFGMAGYADAQTPLLAAWSLRSYADYQSEWSRRSALATLLQAARWFARRYALDEDAVQEAGADAEAVIRMGLLIGTIAPRTAQWPHAKAFEKWVQQQRKKASTAPTSAIAAVTIPADMPAALHPAVQPLCDAVHNDWQKLVQSNATLAPWLRPISAVRAKYFLLDDPLAEVDDYHHQLDTLLATDDDAEPLQPASATWKRLMKDHSDEASVLTLLVCLAAGVPRKTTLTEKQAASLVRKIRKHGWNPSLAADFITEHAAAVHQEDYQSLWTEFAQESHKVLSSDMDYQLYDALALLRRECHVMG